MFEIIIGRDDSDKQKFGNKGCVFLGKQYVKMGQVTSLSNPVYLDVVRSHVVFVCGKRGGGKSYTLGVIAEGISDLPPEIKQNLSIILLDTMGVYWTMKYANKKEDILLKEWNAEAKPLNITIYTPAGFHKKYLAEGIPTDFPFAIKVSELEATDWCSTFGLNIDELQGVLLERIINDLKESKKEYSIQDIIDAVKKDQSTEESVKGAIINHFMNANKWGLFDVKGTPLKDLATGGKVTVLDVSCYATHPNGWKIKSLVIGLVAQKLFIERMLSRKNEEYAMIHKSVSYFSEEEGKKQEMPLVWLAVDEAHEFIPNIGSTVASQPLITILREGRQPGISLILATQQPGKIHTDVMTQADIVISHRITAKMDTDALGTLMQSYMREGLTSVLDNLPRVKGAAIVFDDTNERMYPLRVRPRFTWHGGESPTAMGEEKKKEYEL